MLISDPLSKHNPRLLYHSHAFIGGSTPDVQNRNLTHELEQTLTGYQNTAPGYLALNQQFQPEYGKLNLTNLATQQQGFTDAAGVFHPGTTQLGQDVTASNRSAAVNDLGTFGPSTTVGLLASNPYLAQSMDLQNFAARNAATPTYLQGQLNASAANPAGSPLLNSLNSRAQQTGGSPVLGALQSSAQEQLAANGKLSASETRDLDQSALGLFGSSGISHGNSAIASLLLNRDAATRSRQQQAQQFASGVEGLTQSQTGLENQFGLGVQGANLADRANTQQFGLGVQGQNLQQQGLAASTAGSAANSASGLSNQLLQLLGLGNLNPGYAGTSGSPTGDSVATANQLFNPMNPYVADIYNTNNNAANAANIAGANNSAATNSAILGLVGSLFSDARLKKNVRKTGRKTRQGAPIVSFQYKHDPHKRTYVGVKAQDVEKLNPYAVTTDPLSGLKAVDYAAAEAPFYQIQNPYRKAA